MTRRLLITLGFPPAPGGMQNYLHARCQAAEPDAVTVLAPAATGHRTFDRAQPFDVRRWSGRLDHVPGLRHILRLALPLLHALALYRQKRFDVLECGQALPCGLIGWLFKRAFGTPYLVWSYGRDILNPQQYPLLGVALRRVLKEADLVVSVSESTRQAVIDLGVSPDRVRVIYPSVDTARFRPDVDAGRTIARHSLEDRNVILTVSRLEPRKGVDTVIRALPAIVRAVSDVVYVVAGDGPDRGRLKAIARASGVADRVRFVGAVDAGTLPEYYAACDVFVMVSRTMPRAGEVEGFGIVYLEAGACARPVVAGRGGGVAEAVREGVNGLLVDPDDVTAVSDAVIRVLQDTALARRLGAGGRRRAQAFSSDWEVLHAIPGKRG